MVIPEQWIIVKVKGEDPHYRVFAVWGGGYTYGETWRMNSGIVNVKEDGEFYLFEGHSGSLYKCHKEDYGIKNPYGAGILHNYCKRSSGVMEIMEEIPDIMNMDWII